MPHPDRRILTWLGGAIVMLLACSQFFGAIDSRPMHRDEARWIHRAVYIREILHPFSSYWDEETWLQRGGTLDERYRLRAQPPMGSYVMGIGFLLQGKPLPDIGFWNMDEDETWNTDHGNRPSHEQVITARRTSAAVGILTVLGVYLIATRLTNVAGGLVAGLLLAYNPLMIRLATFAGSDAVLGLTIVLAGVAAYRLADRPTWPRAILLGLAIAAGGSTKLSPLGIVVPLALLGLAGLLYQRTNRHASDRVPRGPALRLALQLLAIPVIAGVAFVASYPWLWRNPVAHTLALVDYRQMGMELQGTMWQQIAVTDRIDAFRRIGVQLGRDWTTLGRTGWNWLPEGLGLAIAAAGLILLAWLVIQRGPWSATGLAAVVLTSGAAITIYGLDADWARYHLPILLLGCICAGILAGSIWTALERRIGVGQRAPARRTCDRPRLRIESVFPYRRDPFVESAYFLHASGAMPGCRHRKIHARRMSMMDTGDMRAMLRNYLAELTWTNGLGKDAILRHVAERDDDLGIMIEEYIPEGTYTSPFRVMTLIPDQAWQDAQGDTWRGPSSLDPAEVESGFSDSPVAGMERQNGTPTKHAAGQPGGGAGRKERAGSQEHGVFPASGPLPDDPDARYQDMASFGQGERGAAGYEDHGDSETQVTPPDK